MRIFVKNRIVEVDGKFYLMDFSNKSFIEVSDYKSPKDGILTPFSCIVDRKEYEFCNETMYQITKKWGCINNKNEVVIPCIYDNMKVFDDVCHAEIKYKKCYFNMDGTPIFSDRIHGIRKTTTFTGWEYVEDFEGKAISIGKKDGKYGILRVDGSCFLSPEYDSIHIDWSNKCISRRQSDKTTQILFFKQKKCWSPIPKDYTFCRRDYNLYVLQKGNKYAAINDNYEIIVPPFFDEIKVFNNIVIASFKGLKGAISREYITEKPYCDIILPFKYDDVKEGERDFGGYLQHLITIKDGKQGVYSIKERMEVLEPIIDCKLHLYTNTIGENAVAFHTEKGMYGLVDFEGNILFYIEKEICIDGKKTSISNPVYFRYGGFKNGIIHVDRGDFYEEYDKNGNLMKKKWTRPQSYDTSYDYEEDTWDAMTDGMYGDTPENFDGDYSFMGE